MASLRWTKHPGARNAGVTGFDGELLWRELRVEFSATSLKQRDFKRNANHNLALAA